jgi:hypothetical protein
VETAGRLVIRRTEPESERSRNPGAMKQHRTRTQRRGLLVAYFLGRPAERYLDRWTRGGSSRQKLS